MIITAVETGPKTVENLAALTGASAITVRRDLAELSECGILQRIRGGAAPLPSRGAQYPFALRQTEHAGVKQALAEAAATLVKPGDAVLIDNGTTALAVASQLAGLGITALALSLHAAAALASKPGNQVIVPGGPISYDDLSFAADSAEQSIRQMRFDYAFIGSCAAQPDSGLTVADWSEAQTKKTILTSTLHPVLVATADKFERTAAHRFASLGDMDTLITTADTPSSALAEARICGLTLITVTVPKDNARQQLTGTNPLSIKSAVMDSAEC